MNNSDIAASFVGDSSMDSFQSDSSVNLDSDINDIAMNDAVVDDVIIDISLQNAIVSTKFVDNFTQWTEYSTSTKFTSQN